MAQPAKRPATYADLDALPEGTKAHLVRGALVVPPRPSMSHPEVESALGEELRPPFHRGRGGPGGWLILMVPEVRVGGDALVPDLGGWRRERLPAVPAKAHATIAPDWVCEVLSRSSAAFDRGEKLDVYASWSVGHAWLVDPTTRTLEAYRLEAKRWVRVGGWSENARVRVEPFEAFELDLASLWSALTTPDED
ncbi:MAG: Uma2 family endonuclease [Myxococcales bacterium]|nr:Uma2 family endonuclease [Myxococcales bacterium]